MTTNLSKQDRPSHIRVFLAVELPEELRVTLAGLQTRFETAGPAARWVAPELLHVTLRFLGEIPENGVSDVADAARSAAVSTEQFRLQMGSMGAFPNERNPRVLWVGLRPDSGFSALQRLRGELERELDSRGFGREDKPFAPHITLARLRDRAGTEERAALGAALRAAGIGLTDHTWPFAVESLTVMRSDLKSGGPRYTALARLPLAASQSTREVAASF